MTMNRVIGTFRNISTYFLRSRGVGHTQAMLGNRVGKTVVLVLDQAHAGLFREIPGIVPVPIDSLERLQGLRSPLLIDNHTATALFWAAEVNLTQARDILVAAKDLISRFGDLRCRGGSAPEWVEAIEAADDITRRINTLLDD